MKPQYVLTAMFYPVDYILQLTRYFDSQRKRLGGLIGPIPYTRSKMPLGQQPVPWRFRLPEWVDNYSVNGEPVVQVNTNWHKVKLDLQGVYVIDWIDWWPEQAIRMPMDWFVDVSLDGETYTRALTGGEVNIREQVGYGVNSALMENGQMTLLPIKARFLRICFNKTTSHNKLDEWAIEVNLVPENEMQAVPAIQPIPAAPTVEWAQPPGRHCYNGILT